MEKMAFEFYKETGQLTIIVKNPSADLEKLVTAITGQAAKELIGLEKPEKVEESEKQQDENKEDDHNSEKPPVSKTASVQPQSTVEPKNDIPANKDKEVQKQDEKSEKTELQQEPLKKDAEEELKEVIELIHDNKRMKEIGIVETIKKILPYLGTKEEVKTLYKDYGSNLNEAVKAAPNKITNIFITKMREKYPKN